jgi:hypothetical protein
MVGVTIRPLRVAHNTFLPIFQLVDKRFEEEQHRCRDDDANDPGGGRYAQCDPFAHPGFEWIHDGHVPGKAMYKIIMLGFVSI